MQQIASKRTEDAGIMDRSLAEQYAEILRLRVRVREAELAERREALSAMRSEKS